MKKGFFRDSVQMMLLTQELKRDGGLMDAAIVMGTTLNKDTLMRCGLLTHEGEKAGESDTIISITCADQPSLKTALERAEALLSRNPEQTKSDFSNVESALNASRGTTVATLSIPGQFVKEVASKMIEKNLHVFVFSDHVPLKDEIDLKVAAVKNNLLFMGPEAGTSIINGTVLGFGNLIRKGNIGIIGASGTGIQESSTLLHLCGSGISHAIGVGGRDMNKEVNGIMTLQAITALEEDQNTNAIMVVSKPVDSKMRDKIVNVVMKRSMKKYVFCFIGDSERLEDTKEVRYARSIQSSVLRILELVDKPRFEASRRRFEREAKASIGFANNLSETLITRQNYVRGLFAGGTLCYESKAILEEILGPVFSNLSANSRFHLQGRDESRKNTLIDFGEGEFTLARPHPIIDPSFRIERLMQEARDPSVGVIILDLIAGYGVSKDSIELFSRAISEAIETAGKANRTLPIFLYVCGTEGEISPSDIDSLRDSGAQVFTSNALMALTAGLVLRKPHRHLLRRLANDYLGVDIK